jgi:hypothetical protein
MRWAVQGSNTAANRHFSTVEGGTEDSTRRAPTRALDAGASERDRPIDFAVVGQRVDVKHVPRSAQPCG